MKKPNGKDRLLKIKLLPKQYEFIEEATEKEILYSGAFGAGKSRALCYAIWKRAMIPGNVVGLFRKTNVSLVRTTLRTLLMPDGDLPPVLPIGSYEHHASAQIIKLNGGGEIIYCGLDKPETIASLNLGAAGVDECIEISEDEHAMILGRLRMTTDPNRSLYLVTNPGNPSHYLHKRFFEQHDPTRRVIQTRSDENIYLPADYIAMLNTFTGTRKQRYVEGKWVGFEGLVYGDLWDRGVHVQHREGPWVGLYVGVDEGYTNPAVLLLIGKDSDGRLHIIDEWYKTKQLPEAVVSAAEAMHALEYIYDPSAAGLAASMKAKALNCIPANNDIFQGIQAVQSRLAVCGDGRPRLSIEPHCENTIREFESYVWDKTKKHGEKDLPVKEFDHAMDALRYSVMRLDKGYIYPSISASKATPTPDEVKEKEELTQSFDADPSDEAVWSK